MGLSAATGNLTHWFVVDNAVYTANTFDDSVKITEDGVDFGATNTFFGNAPKRMSRSLWKLLTGNPVSEVLTRGWR